MSYRTLETRNTKKRRIHNKYQYWTEVSIYILYYVATFSLSSCVPSPVFPHVPGTRPARWAWLNYSEGTGNAPQCLDWLTRLWVQASLPVSRGGLGIWGVQSLSLPAFLASTANTSNLVSRISVSWPSRAAAVRRSSPAGAASTHVGVGS
jgi:hypothetical protein